MKIQMVELFRRKPGVYIRQLQVRMPISAINSLTSQWLFAEPPPDSGGVDDVDCPKLAGEFRL